MNIDIPKSSVIFCRNLPSWSFFANCNLNRIYQGSAETRGLLPPLKINKLIAPLPLPPQARTKASCLFPVTKNVPKKTMDINLYAYIFNFVQMIIYLRNILLLAICLSKEIFTHKAKYLNSESLILKKQQLIFVIESIWTEQ